MQTRPRSARIQWLEHRGLIPRVLLVLCSGELTVILLAFGTNNPVFKLAQSGQCELDRETSLPQDLPLFPPGGSDPITYMGLGQPQRHFQAPPPRDREVILTNHWLLPERCSTFIPQRIILQISEGHKQY